MSSKVLFRKKKKKHAENKTKAYRHESTSGLGHKYVVLVIRPDGSQYLHMAFNGIPLISKDFGPEKDLSHFIRDFKMVEVDLGE